MLESTSKFRRQLFCNTFSTLFRHPIKIVAISTSNQHFVSDTQAHKQGLKGHKIVWILPRWILSGIISHLDEGVCTEEELTQMTELILGVELRRPQQSVKEMDTVSLTIIYF